MRTKEPLLKVTLNLYHSDVIRAKLRWGHGYTEQLREIIHAAFRNETPTRTIEDYVREDLDGE